MSLDKSACERSLKKAKNFLQCDADGVTTEWDANRETCEKRPAGGSEVGLVGHEARIPALVFVLAGTDSHVCGSI